MIKYFIFFSILFHNVVVASDLPWHHYEETESSVSGLFNVIKHEYTFSTEFELEWEGMQYARALKSSFHLRTQYDLYDSEGEFVCTGFGNWIPTYGLGWIYTWAADFSLYGKNGNYIGSFKGTLYTDAVAKFIFYDSSHTKIAIAYMDKERNTFCIRSPHNFTKKILEVNRQVAPYKIDYWTTQIYEDRLIPPELIQVFAIFACDRQDDFIKN
jgi:hypothetical protein